MPYINVDEAYVLDNTGLQVDQAVDYGLYNANRNLMDNPFFTIRQKGTTGTVTTTNGFVADRWKKSGSSGSVIIGTNYMTPTGGGGIRQMNEWSKIRNGKTYTLSCMLTNGNVYSATATLSSAASGYQISAHLIQGSLWCGVQNNNGYMDVLFTSADGTPQIMAVKLELGSYSTLINDVPPNPEMELLICQRYFRRIKSENLYGVFGSGVYYSNGTNAYISIPINMRKAPTSGTSSGAFRLIGGSTQTGITLSYNGSASSANMARIDVTGSGFTSGQACLLTANNDADAYIDFSADL